VSAGTLSEMSAAPPSYDDRWREAPPTSEDDRGRNGGRSGPLITPTRVTILLALVGSVAYLAYAVTVRDASQIPMLSSGAAVLGIVFGALAVSGLVATWRAGVDGRGGRALMSAIFGGIAALVAAGCIAAAVILALVWQSS
jgi:hypothetical protein